MCETKISADSKMTDQQTLSTFLDVGRGNIRISHNQKCSCASGGNEINRPESWKLNRCLDMGTGRNISFLSLSLRVSQIPCPHLDEQSRAIHSLFFIKQCS